MPGTTARIPLTLALHPGVSVDSVTFGLTISPVATAPALTGALSFEPAAAWPAPDVADTALGPGSIAASWLSLPAPRTGTALLGNVVMNVPAGAVQGHAYTVHITAADAAFGAAPQPLLGASDATLTISSYGAGDVFPFTSHAAGDFGNNTIDILDLIHTLRAVTSLPGFVPRVCSDRFDAMDTFPADGVLRGGDGALTILDLIVTLRRAVALDASRPRRTPRGLACAAVVERGSGEERRAGPPDAALELGAAGTGGVPVYLRAEQELPLAGLAMGFKSDLETLEFGAGNAPPPFVDRGVSGALALAWLEGLLLRAGERLLLGNVRGPAAVEVLRVSATLTDGREVVVTTPARRRTTR